MYLLSFLLLAKFTYLSKHKLFQEDLLSLACMNVWGVWCTGACGGQKRRLPFLELKLQLVESRHSYMLGTRLGYLGRASGIQTMSFWLKWVTTPFLPCARSFLTASRRIHKAREEEEREPWPLVSLLSGLNSITSLRWVYWLKWHCDWTALLEMGFTLKAGVMPTLKLSREEWKHRAEFSAEWGTEQ